MSLLPVWSQDKHAQLSTGTASSIAAREHGLRVGKALKRSQRDLRRSLHKATEAIQERNKAKVRNAVNAVGVVRFMQSEVKRGMVKRLKQRAKAARANTAAGIRSRSPTRVKFSFGHAAGVAATPHGWVGGAAGADDGSGSAAPAMVRHMSRGPSMRSMRGSASMHSMGAASSGGARRPGLSRASSHAQLRARIEEHRANQAAFMHHRPETNPSESPGGGALSLKAMLAAGAMMQGGGEPALKRSSSVRQLPAASPRGSAAALRGSLAGGGSRTAKSRRHRRLAKRGTGTSIGSGEARGAPGSRTLNHAASFVRDREQRREKLSQLRARPGDVLAPSGSHKTRSLTTKGRTSDELDIVRIDDLFPSNAPTNKYHNDRPSTAPTRSPMRRLDSASRLSPSNSLMAPEVAASVLAGDAMPLAAAIRATTPHHSAVTAFADTKTAPSRAVPASNRRPASASAGARAGASVRQRPRRLNRLGSASLSASRATSPVDGPFTGRVSPVPGFHTPKPSSFRFFHGPGEDASPGPSPRLPVGRAMSPPRGYGGHGHVGVA